MKKGLALTTFGLFFFIAFFLATTLVQADGVKTQLCLVIDGSGSIDYSQWENIKQALATAVKQNLPHDGTVELTVVQFGYSLYEGYAKTELQPTVINSANYGAISDQILAMPKGDSETPIAHGLFLAWIEMKNSPNSGANVRKIINLATDGEPNVRNNNATTDLDGSGGSPDASDDVIASVNTAVSQGLNELDIEGIGMIDVTRDWLKNWVVYPQPGIVAPPFSKAGWIRVVADPTEFANTLGERLQGTLSGDADTWVPTAEGALAAGALSVGVTGAISALGSAVANPEVFPRSTLVRKTNDFLPEFMKKWLNDFISSKRKLTIMQKKGHLLKLTKLEIMSYTIALLVLTLAFSYAKSQTLAEVLTVVPTILATSIIVEFAKNFAVETIARSQGVWTEHRLWYFGLGAFLFSTFVFRTPFSSPSRNIHTAKFTKRSLGLVSSVSVFIGLAFAAIFYIFLINGFALIGSIGIVMSLTIAFFEALPIPPMNGKDIYDWSRPLWTVMFTATFALYMLCLLIL
jgi:Zn-dependent protease